MKKTLPFVAAGIVLFFLVSFTFLQYRNYRSYKNRVHKNACLVFKINVNRLISTSSEDFIGIFSPLVKQRKRSKAAARLLPQGLEFPANVFIHTFNSKSAKTFFSSPQVTDSAALKAYFTKALDIRNFSRTANGRFFGSTENRKISVAFDARNLAISYSFSREAVDDVLNEMLVGKSFLSDRSPLIRKLKAENAPVSYVYKSYAGTINFRNNSLLLDGSFPIARLDIPKQSYMLSGTPNNLALQLWINARLRRFMVKDTLLFKGYTLEKDTLSKYYDGFAAIEIGQSITQKNEVVTYAYNDDFQKTEHISSSVVKVPGINISLNGDARQLSNYMKEQLVINKEQKLCKDLFPLYDIYSAHNDHTLQLSTRQQKTIGSTLVKTPYFFLADINFEELRRQNHFSFLNSYISYFRQLKARAVKKNSNEGHLEMELTFNSKSK